MNHWLGRLALTATVLCWVAGLGELILFGVAFAHGAVLAALVWGALSAVTWVVTLLNLHNYRRYRRGLRIAAAQGTGVPATGGTFVGSFHVTFGASAGAAAVHFNALGPAFSEPATRTCPRLAEPVRDYAIGFRQWYPVRPSTPPGLLIAPTKVLYSIGVNAEWHPGWNQAECWPHALHEAPLAECHCGFYAFNHCAPDLARESIYGAVQAKGRIAEHAEGFRAEHARVLALGMPICVLHAEAATLPSADGPCPIIAAARPLAEAYGVPLLALDQLEAYALEFGQRMGTDLPPDSPRDLT